MSDKQEKIVTPEFRLSFPAVFKGRPKESDKTKLQYSLTMLFPKSADIAEVRRICKNAVVAKWGADPAKWPKPLHNPIQDGDQKPEWGGYAGHTYVRATTQIQPPVFDQNAEPIPALDQNKVYAGCWCRAQIHAYAWENSGKRGVSVGLDAVQLVRDDEPFAGGVDGTKTFGKVAGGVSSKDDPTHYEKPAEDPFN